jgi:hypothetical protein
MSTKSEILVRRISDVIEADDRLRQVLLDYRRANVNLAKRIGNGDPGVIALTNLNASIRRRTVTESMEEFESARHLLRVALFALCMEEGASISDVGKVLGISRQLASRLAAEVDRSPS